MEFSLVLSDSMLNHHHWTLFLQFKHRIRHWKQQIPYDHRKEKLRRRGKGFKDSEPVQEKKKRITVQIPSLSQEISETESRFKVSEGFDSKSPDWTQVTHKLNLIALKSHHKFGSNANPWKIRTVWFKTLTLTSKQFENAGNRFKIHNECESEWFLVDLQRLNSRNMKKTKQFEPTGKIRNSCWFHGWKHIPVTDSCLEQQYKAFKPWMFRFWVDSRN